MNTLRLLFSCLLLAAGVLRAAEETPVSAPASAFDRDVLRTTLATELAAHYSLADELEVSLVRPWESPVPADDAGAVEVSVVEYPETLAPAMLVRVRYLREKKILREDTLALRVNLWRDAMFAAAPLVRGDAVSLKVVELRRVDALRDREALPASMAVEDYVFARAIPAGRPLTWRDVARRSLVHKGRMVEVLASDGSLVITMKALAMQDGAQGDSIRVRNLESKREFIAQVTSENRAEVRF
jgi:flagellar basal body P-ring formation protein FlgA